MNPETRDEALHCGACDGHGADDPVDIAAIKRAVLADAIQRVEGLPRYEAASRSFLRETPEGSMVVRAAVLAILRDLGDGAGS